MRNLAHTRVPARTAVRPTTRSTRTTHTNRTRTQQAQPLDTDQLVRVLDSYAREHRPLQVVEQPAALPTPVTKTLWQYVPEVDPEDVTFDLRTVADLKITRRSPLPRVTFKATSYDKLVYAEFSFNAHGEGTHSVIFYNRTHPKSRVWNRMAIYGHFPGSEFTHALQYLGRDFVYPPEIVDFVKAQIVNHLKGRLSRMVARITH